MSQVSATRRQKTYCQRPQVGHDQDTAFVDLLFEKRARFVYKASKRRSPQGRFTNEFLAQDAQDGTVYGLFRIGALGNIPEGSLVARNAESKALDAYKRQQLRLTFEQIEMRAALSAGQVNILRHGINSDVVINQDLADLQLKVARMDYYLSIYESCDTRYCFGLKFCFPMYFLHHMDHAYRTNNAEYSGSKFHCPCGAGNVYWRSIYMGIPGETPVMFQDDDENLPDFCGGVDSYDDLSGLLDHLNEKRKGPMHKAAMTYILEIYYAEQLDTGGVEVPQTANQDMVVKSETSPNANTAMALPGMQIDDGRVVGNFDYIRRQDVRRADGRCILDPEGDRLEGNSSESESMELNNSKQSPGLDGMEDDDDLAEDDKHTEYAAGKRSSSIQKETVAKKTKYMHDVSKYMEDV